MNRKQNRMVRLVAIILAVLLGFSAVISAVLSIAYGEEALPAERNQCELTMEYLGEEQALRISQRLVYINESGNTLDRVIFYAPANLFRRYDSLPYDAQNLAAAFPAGYLPGGIDLAAVYVNGMECDWGFQGEDEIFLRVACNLMPGESCRFEFEYYLLLTQNAAFLGTGENHWRLSNFYFAPARLDSDGEFILNHPISFAQYMDVPAADFRANIVLPDGLMLASTGQETLAVQDSGMAAWTIEAENVHDFVMVIGKGYREYTTETSSGVQIRLLSNVKKTADDILEIICEAVEVCENWFGTLPFRQLDVVQADCALESMNHSACLWLDESLLKEGGHRLEHTLRAFVAQQYFGRCIWVRPSADAWLSDAVSEFVAYLISDETRGHSAYLQAINEYLVPSLQLTIPGGLNVTSDAALFTAYEYEIVVKNRGAAVFHELCTAMGREDLLEGLRLFYSKGSGTEALTEMDLADALESASGKSWKKFLTDWLFNIGDYVNQDLYWLD